MWSRQFRRAVQRQIDKQASPKYPHDAQKGGPSLRRVRRNRQFRGDGLDYFDTGTRASGLRARNVEN
jgi:hypothetical protein